MISGAVGVVCGDGEAGGGDSFVEQPEEIRDRITKKMIHRILNIVNPFNIGSMYLIFWVYVVGSLYGKQIISSLSG